MTTIAVICFVMSLALAGGVAHPRTRKLLLAEKKPLALPPASQNVEDWKKVFRETVISVDGGISPEMEAFLSGTTQGTGVERYAGEEEIAFLHDFDACRSGSERLSVIQRWHKRFVFTENVRMHIMSKFSTQWDESERDDCRKMFDKQDRRRRR